MMRADILVINPNSNPVVTAGIDGALATLRFADGPSIRCATLAEGPFGIESQKDVEEVTLPLRRMVEQDNASAISIDLIGKYVISAGYQSLYLQSPPGAGPRNAPAAFPGRMRCLLRARLGRPRSPIAC
jgi:hypothetical protein